MKNPKWVRNIILFISLLALAPAAAFIGTRLTIPSDGARLEPGQSNLHAEGVEVIPLRSRPGGLQEGDIVLAAGGINLEVWAGDLFRPGTDRPDWQVGEVVTYSVLRDGHAQEVQVELVTYPFAAVIQKNWGTILFAFVFLVVGAFVFFRRPDNPAASLLFISASCIMSATTWSFGLQVSDFVYGAGFWLYKITSLGVYSIYWITGFYFALFFPKPLPVVHKHGWIMPGSLLFAFLFAAAWITGTRYFSTSILDWLSKWVAAEGVIAGAFLGLALVTFFRQYRINTSGATRQQIRWVIWAALLSGGAGLLFYILPGAVGIAAVNPNLVGVIVLPFPIAIAIAILRHNLFEIDKLINRTLVYGSLTAIIIGLYLLVVTSLGIFFQTQGNWFVSLAATGLAAILFHPLREWLSRWVNRWMYGERDDPFEVLARLGQRLEGTISPQAVLPTIVETVAQVLKLPYVALLLPVNSRLEAVASYGKPTVDVVSYPLLNQGESVGEFVIAPRARDEPFNDEEERLLSSIARQTGAAVHAVLLNNDLQLSRQRLVNAQEEERRRLRRDLHDGVGPTLAAHLLKIGSARSLLLKDPTMADRYLGELEEETENILSEIRRLVYNLRPPSLDQLGLVGAIRASTEQYNQSPDSQQLRVFVDAPDLIPPLPAAVEVAAYRICQEALTNVARHAGATHCYIQLRFDNALHLTISDNGRGLPAQHRAGVGLASMHERASELGGTCEVRASKSGGTEIKVVIPLQEYLESEDQE